MSLVMKLIRVAAGRPGNTGFNGLERDKLFYQFQDNYFDMSLKPVRKNFDDSDAYELMTITSDTVWESFPTVIFTQMSFRERLDALDNGYFDGDGCAIITTSGLTKFLPDFIPAPVIYKAISHNVTVLGKRKVLTSEPLRIPDLQIMENESREIDYYMTHGLPRLNFRTSINFDTYIYYFLKFISNRRGKLQDFNANNLYIESPNLINENPQNLNTNYISSNGVSIFGRNGGSRFEINDDYVNNIHYWSPDERPEYYRTYYTINEIIYPLCLFEEIKRLMDNGTLVGFAIHDTINLFFGSDGINVIASFESRDHQIYMSKVNYDQRINQISPPLPVSN